MSQLSVEHLTTYQNIGSAFCTLDDGPLVRLDGLSEGSSRTSHERMAMISETVARGAHSLSCMSDGRKFKITRIIGAPTQGCVHQGAGGHADSVARQRTLEPHERDS